jgi:hypothetical protein
VARVVPRSGRPSGRARLAWIWLVAAIRRIGQAASWIGARPAPG